MTSQPYNLLAASWLPVRRASGDAWIRPTQITEAIDVDPVRDIAWPRPDFRLAAIEFLIGLLSTFAPPPDEESWEEQWHHPPAPAQLDAALNVAAHAFNLDGDGPRFMQDLDALANGAANPIGALFIEAPGDQTLRNNADLLIKRGRVNRLSRPGAAIALFTLQTYAPSGGAGHRVGLRGGGPLTTLVLPQEQTTLWRLAWAHVLPGQPARIPDLPKVMPWLAALPTSEKKLTANAAGMLDRHVFWGMPRRIRLEFETNPDGNPCDLTGDVDAIIATGWRTRPHGLFYKDWIPPHPLSPYYRQKLTDTPLPRHGQSAGVGYRDWVGLVVSDDQGLRLPAESIRYFRYRRERYVAPDGARLFAGGYDMDNMKARGFIESEMPLPPTADLETTQVVDQTVRTLVRAANIAADSLRFALRTALAADVTNATIIDVARDSFWRLTEPRFFDLLHGMAKDVRSDTVEDSLVKPWLNELRRAALACFDEAAPLAPEQYREDQDGARIVRARGILLGAMNGRGAAGKQLFEVLGLASPEPRKPIRKSSRSST